MPTYSHDDILKIATNMIEYGGHFASYIGKALIHADGGNRDRLAQAFPELFEKYFKWPSHVPQPQDCT